MAGDYQQAPILREDVGYLAPTIAQHPKRTRRSRARSGTFFRAIWLSKYITEGPSAREPVHHFPFGSFRRYRWRSRLRLLLAHCRNSALFVRSRLDRSISSMYENQGVRRMATNIQPARPAAFLIGPYHSRSSRQYYFCLALTNRLTSGHLGGDQGTYVVYDQ